MSRSRECKVCNTVNSSGAALQARGLPVYQFLTGTIHAKLKQGIEDLGTSPGHCAGEPVLFIWENLTDSSDSTGSCHYPAQFVCREHTKVGMARYTMCIFMYNVAWNSITVQLPHYSKAKDTQSAHGWFRCESGTECVLHRGGKEGASWSVVCMW